MISENAKSEIKEHIDLKELEKLPETIEDLERHPILKPLLEFHKQSTMLSKEDDIEANFLKQIKDDLKIDLDSGIYDRSYIVSKYKKLESEYDRLILIYSRYTTLADEKIIEVKRIVEKYYITKREALENEKRLLDEIEELKQKLKEAKSKKIEEVKPGIEIKEEIVDNAKDEQEVVEEESNENDYQEFLKRKIKGKIQDNTISKGGKRG